MKEKRTRRWLSLLLTVVMVLSLFPATVVFAAEGDEETGADYSPADVEVIDVAEDGIPDDLAETAKEMLDDLADEPDEVSSDAEAPGTEEPTGTEEVTEPTDAANYGLETEAEDAGTYTTGSPFYKIFHLDCGRKYFSVDQVKQLIDFLAANDYTHMELAIGNDGLRFLLDDMAVGSYTSEDVTAGIKAGNEAYNNSIQGGYSPEVNEWSQDQMDIIIAYAEDAGIEIIPLLNTPGHMDAILDCMGYLGISSPAYSTSGRTVDVTNTAAVNFTLELVNKYIEYFAGKGCKFFNMGCDEYANDVSNSGFAGLISSGKYGDFINYVNDMAKQVKAAGMTPMAFNDGIYYNSNTSYGNFDNDIMVAYWTTGWSGYSPASASFLADKGHKIINTNDAWYYVLGRAAGDSRGYTIATARNGVVSTVCDDIPGDDDPTAYGCMICLWCDTPSAEYDGDEVNNVKGLISTFAAKNSDVFDPEEDADAVEVTENETITVTVGQTASATISGANYEENVNEFELNKSIATVKVSGVDGSEATKTYEEASVTCNTLISSNSNNWTAVSGYYYKAADGNYYPLYAKRSSSGKGTKTYTYTWGYSTTSSTSNVTQIGTQSTTNTSTTPNITVYTKSGTEATPASTTVTFTGLAVGTTYVTVGNTRYTINVIAEDLSKVDPVQIEWWITNYPITSTDENHTADGSYTANGKTTYYTKLKAEKAYGEEGVELSAVVPATGTFTYAGEEGCVFWKGTRLTGEGENVKQTGASGSDSTAVGDGFAYIRYFDGKWEISADRETWTEISTSDQLVAYYLQATKVTKEVTTMTKDWGLAVGTKDGSDSQVALSVAVVYPDGTLSPAEENIYSTSTLIYNYWDERDIGIVAPELNDQYDVAKITVTPGSRVSGKSGIFTTASDDGIVWEKKTINEDGDQWFNETSYWDDSMNTTPMVNGQTSNIVWPSANSAYLVLIYLKPVHYDTNLIVNWVDDSAGGSLISTMEVAVSSDGEETTFYNGLKQTSALPTKGVGGTFTLDDDAYVINSSNVPQKFNKNISTVPGVADQYKTGVYQYVSAELSADGKTLTLHYNVDSSKLAKQYVLDFGLPVSVPLSDFIENLNSVSIQNVEITTNNAEYDGTNNAIIYTPTDVMLGTVTVNVKVTFENGKEVTYKIGFIPASNVLYEDDFLKENTEKGTEDTYKQWVQTNATISGTQNSDQELLYGYDTAYADSTGNSMGSCWSVGFDSTYKASRYLTTTFTGTGFDLIGTSGPNTGYVYLSIKGGSVNKLIIIDTSYGNTEEGDTLYQVPLAHVEGLDQGTYTVNIRAAYRAGNDTHPVEGTTVTIDGFRVYRSTDDEAYTAEGEKGAQYYNILDAIEYENGRAAFTEFEADRELVSREDYEGNGGPQNEVYLTNGQAVVLDTNLKAGDKVQVSARAVTGTTAVLNTTRISSNTEMYYVVEAGENGTIVFTNNGDGLLALGNLKVLGSAGTAAATAFAFEEVTDETLQTASLMMVAYAAGPEEETFTPEKLDVSVKSSNGIRNKRITVTVTASADVAKLTINGETVNPSRTRKGKRGEITQYTYVFTDTAKRGETKSYDIIAYNADGVASDTTTVTG